MRQFNLRLILWLAGIFVVAAVGIHFLHGYQVRRNSQAFLDMARKSEQELRDMVEQQVGTQKQLENAVRQTVLYYQRYLGLQEDDDLAVRIEYANFLRDIGDFQRAYGQNERILRADVVDDPELLAEQEKVREMQIQLAGAFKEYSDGIYHINELLETRAHDADLLELRGLYQLNQEDTIANNEAARDSFQEAIEYHPDHITTYARLAALERERFDNRDAGIEVINQLVTANAENAQAYILRARFMMEDKDPAVQARPIRRKLLQDCVVDCEKARELDPTSADAVNVQSVCHERLVPLMEGDTLEETIQLQAQEYAKSMDLLQQLVKLRPDVPGLYERWCNLELKSPIDPNATFAQKRDRAINVLREGLTKVDPENNFVLRWRLADLLLNDPTRRDEAAEIIQQMEQEQPESELTIYAEARQLMTQRQWLSAVRKLEDVREKLEKYPELKDQIELLLGTCYAQLGDQDLNLEVARQAVEKNPTNPSVQANLGEALVAVNRLPEALKAYEAAVGLQPNSLAFRKRYAELLLAVTYRQSPDRRDWPAVGRAVELVAQNATEDDDWVPLMRAEVLASSDRIDDAVKVLEEAREKNPNQLKLTTALIELANKQDDDARVQQLINDMEKKFGDTLDVRVVKARALLRQEGAEAAGKLKELTADLEQQPDNFPEAERLQFYWQLAQLCFGVGAYDEGLQYGQQVADLAPTNLRLRMVMLDIARMARNVSAAQQLADEVQRIEGGGPVSSYADALVDVTRYSAAVAPAFQADLENKDKNQTLTKEARAENEGLLVQARQKLAEAARERPGWSNVPVLQGLIAGFQGNEDVAINYFRKAIELGDRNPSIAFRVVQALAREASKGGEEAGDNWLEADAIIRKLQDQRASLPRDLGRLASEINYFRQDYDRALDLARPLAQTGEVQDQLWVGQVAMALGNFTEAQENLELAAQESPEDPVVWTSLVRCLTLAGKQDEAATTLQEALTKIDNPESRMAVEAECLRMMGKVDEAIFKVSEETKSADATAKILQTAARFFAAIPQTYEQALPILDDFISGKLSQETEEPEKTERWARREKARIIAQRDYSDFRDAIALLDENLQQDPDSLEDKRLRAKLLAARAVNKQQKQQAATDLIKLSEEGALDVESRYLLAKHYLEEGDWQKYVEEMTWLLRASEGTARQALYMSDYIDQLLKHGEANMAQGISNTFRRKWPGEITASLIRARALGAGIRPRAEDMLKVVQQAIDNPDVKPESPLDKKEKAAEGLLGITNELQGRVEELDATAKDDDATAQEKEVAEALAGRIRSNIKQVNAKVGEYYNDIAEADETRRLAIVPLLVAEDKGSEAVALFTTVDPENREDGKANWQLATPARLARACSALLSSNVLPTEEREAVESILEQAVARYEEEESDEVVGLWSVLASYYVRWNRFDKAIALYQKIVEKTERDFSALNNLSLLMASEKQDLPLALEYVQKAVQLVGPVPLVLDSRAMVRLAAGQKEESLQDMQAVIAEVPASLRTDEQKKRWGGYYFHLAAAYDANSDTAKAKAAMAEVKKLGFTDEDVFEPELGLWDKMQPLLPKKKESEKGS